MWLAVTANSDTFHASARTTAVVRRAIQRSEESLRALAKPYGVNQKTIIKWRKRTSTADLPMGSKDPRSSSLTIEEEAVVVAFRRHTLLPLDDCLYALQATIAHLMLVAAPLPAALLDQPVAAGRWRQAGQAEVQPLPIGYFHIDIAEVRTAEGRLYLYAAIDRTSKFAFVQLVKTTSRVSASAFLKSLIAAVPYKITPC